MMALGGPFTGLLDLRQLPAAGPLGCCKGMQADLQRMHAAARQLFGGVLAQPSPGPFTLGRMLASLRRQIEAGRGLRTQLADSGADEALQAELASLIAYFEAVADEVAARLGSRSPVEGGMPGQAPADPPFRETMDTLCEARGALCTELERLARSEPLDRPALERLREAAHALAHLADILLVKMTRRGAAKALAADAEEIFDSLRAVEEQIEVALGPDHPVEARKGSVRE